MKKFLKTLVVSLLTAALLCCSLPAAFAADSTTQTKETEIFTVGLDAMGGNCSAVAVTTNLNGKLSALPEQPSLDGYTFDGWYTEPVGGTKITTSTVFTSDTTVYAHWTVKNGAAATAPSAPAAATESPEVLNHLGIFVVGGVLLGTVILAVTAASSGSSSAA